jgi:drug/metabolite transporter (DMT)-like permease
MPRFDIYKTISQTGDSLKQLSVFNPLTIHKKGTKAKAAFALGLVCFLWGTTWIASKQGVRYMPALQLASIRQIIAGLCYVIFFLIKGAKLPKGKEWISILVLSFLNFVMSNGLTTWSVQYISAGLGAIMAAIFPLMAGSNWFVFCKRKNFNYSNHWFITWIRRCMHYFL